MSAHHRRACAMMSRASRLYRPERHMDLRCTVYPYGVSPHSRRAGSRKMPEMRECMPYYYQAVDGHGNGAEHVMQGGDVFYAKPPD